ncbi:MAG: winged helix-turn-helix domain-containing protein, partial [Bacteroidota bacterium]
TERSIDVQIVGLRKKMGKHKDHLETVRGVGYRLRE